MAISEITYTPIDAIAPTVKRLNSTFLSHKTRPLEWRLTQLRKLYWGLKDNEALIVEACKKDLGKSSYETYLSEHGVELNEIIYVCSKLQKWMKDETAQDVPLQFKTLGPKIRKDPLGTVLIIGAYNFPIQLSIGPLIGAIAAGCTAVLKPSESAPAAAVVMQKILAESLDPNAYTVIQGAIPETTALLDLKWDKIFYTGGEVVGKIIAKKAAEHLTPVTLELGGRNPAIITKHADPRLAARRLLWNKVFNAGQICVSHNYTLVDREIKDAFLAQLKIAFAEYFPKGAENSPDYGRIVNAKQWQRLKALLDESNGKILFGGKMNEQDLFIEPTVVEVYDANDKLVVEESFGPFFPILTVDNLDEAIRIANQVHETPLACYPFGNKAETAKILDQTRSGGASVNDGMIHATMAGLPFGGVGTSGTGAYHGRNSFDCFSHRRGVVSTPGWMEGLLNIRYMPYGAGKEKKYKSMSELKPNFGRDGQVKSNAIKRLVGLGANSPVSGIGRWLFVLLIALGIRKYYGPAKL